LSSSQTPPRLITLSSVGGALLGGLVFVGALLNYTRDVGRSPTAIGYAANFFETQAKAFLDGHLWVPDGSLSIEGFVQPDGHTYMYFGPFPALLRIPMLLVTDQFNGQLTVTSMFLAWLVLAVFVSRLCWLIRDLLRGDEPVTRTDAALAFLIIAGLTGGTVLTFDAALPWVYHEVYLWQSALVVAAMYWMIRVVREPDPRHFAWLGACALGAAWTRTTGGWGVCLAVLLLAAWMRWGRTNTHLRSWAPWALAAALIPLAAGIAVNMMKFGHPFMFPLENQVWTEVNEHRREALRVNGGSITGLQFFVPALVAYFGLGIRFVDYFPWITLPAHAPDGYGAFIDQAYRTGSVTMFMPLFLLLALTALPVILRPTGSHPRGEALRSLRAPALAGFLMTGGVMAYGYFAYRYTSEFVPALALGTLIALWAWVAPLARRSRARAVGLGGVVAAGVAFGMVANSAVGLTEAATQYQGEKLARYVSWQNDISGGRESGLSRIITTAEELPETGRADELLIVGDCDALYLGTGREDEAWSVVEQRNQVLEVRFPDPLKDGETLLFESDGPEQREVLLRTRRDGFAWLVFANEDGRINGAPFQPAPEQVMRVGLRGEPSLGVLELSSAPGGFVGYLPAQEWSDDWLVQHRTFTSPWTEAGVDEQTLVSVRPGVGVAPTLCPALAADNDIALP
jgi:hypothetical protein